MEEKVTLSTLVSMLSLRTGDSKKESEDFIRELFSLISECLQEGESVKVKGLGVFKVIEVDARKSVNVNDGTETLIPPHRKVTFIPSKELAALVNEPFEMFQTVELSDEAASRLMAEEPSQSEDDADQDLMAEDNPQEEMDEREPEINADEKSQEWDSSEEDVLYQVTEETEPNEIITVETIPFGDMDQDKVREDKEPDQESIDVRTEIPEEPSEEAEDSESEQETTSEIMNEPAEAEEYDEENIDGGCTASRARNYYWLGVVTGIVVSAIGIVLFWNLYGKTSKDVRTGQREEQIAKVNAPVNSENAIPATKDSLIKSEDSALDNENTEDAEMEVPTQPSDKKEYDTITTTRYLTTMAKDHYGNYHLWPYIYKENEKFLGHPDRIRPGTKVVIPSLSKYGVDPKNPADIEKAKKMGVEIYARYK